MSDETTSSVLFADGTRGVLVSAPSGAEQAVVRLENGTLLRVPASLLTARPQGDGYTALMDARPLLHLPTEHSPLVIPLSEEFVTVEKRAVQTGGARVRTAVREREETVSVPVKQERVDVRTVAVNKIVEQTEGTRQVGDTLIVPLYEEVLVVEKRLLLREEVHITRRAETVEEQQTVTLRREEAVVERLDAQGQPPVASQEGGAL